CLPWQWVIAIDLTPVHKVGVLLESSFHQDVAVAAWFRAPGIYPRLLVVEVDEQLLLRPGLHDVV
ncbi:MAG: hypothetical protein ACKPKO_21555, partial [Candidatus Fonsibacter sp.]